MIFAGLHVSSKGVLLVVAVIGRWWLVGMLQCLRICLNACICAWLDLTALCHDLHCSAPVGGHCALLRCLELH
jgi:hypothetical protein